MRLISNLMRFRRKPHIVVIGSAHMDVLGDFRKSEIKRIDREGEVFCSIGGTGFNIAVNLANQAGVSVSLYTHLRTSSPITTMVIERLKQEGVKTALVFTDPTIDVDSGFIAHRADGELISAVSSMPLEKVTLRKKTLSVAISKAALVLAECNLSDTQLAQIIKMCATYDKKLIIGGVSESKCLRLKVAVINGTEPTTIFAFVINIKEAKALFGGPFNSSCHDEVINICAMVKSQTVVVTDGVNGWTVCHADGRAEKFLAPNVPGVSSTSGAGDALTAAIAHEVATHELTDWAQTKPKIHHFVSCVLKKKVASGADLSSIETLGAAYNRGLGFKVEHPLVKAIAIIVGSITLISGIVQAAVSLETSTKVWKYVAVPYCLVVPTSDVCSRAKVP